MTENSINALKILRTTDNLQWHLVPLIVIVFYIYLNEAQKGNLSAVFLGTAMWAYELVWEMFNGLILHFTGFAALWSTPGNTAYLIYVGLPIEISIFFALGGLLLIKALPPDKDLKIAGINNRVFIVASAGFGAVIGEFALNRAGILGWDYRLWGYPHLWVIFINYFGPAWALVRLHDSKSLRTKRLLARGLIVAAIVCHLIFATLLGWV